MDNNHATDAVAPPLRRSQRFAKRAESKPTAASQDCFLQQAPQCFLQQAPQCLHLAPQLTAAEPAALSELEGFSDSNLQRGLWSLLPDELVDNILNLCNTHQLGMLETTCAYFRRSTFIDRIAKQRLKAVPRARGLKPNRKEGEHTLSLLHFVNSQSVAAAQATAVSCGAYHTAALLVLAEVADDPSTSTSRDCKHSLYTFGRGFHGQLGFGAHSNSSVPKLASLGYRACADNTDMEEETMPAVVACGSHHSASISRRGELFMWGLGSSGELGLGQWSPMELTVPRQCLVQTRIVSIAAGANHTLAIAETGALWSCGRGKQGQLGLGAIADNPRLTRIPTLEGVRVVSASAGITHSLALAADGSLFTWGDGRYGQLGHKALQQQAQAMVLHPRKIAELDPAPLTPDARVTAIAAGAYHSMALTVGGALLVFGRNDQGALGTGDKTDRWTPTRVDLNGDDIDDGKSRRAVQVSCGAAHTLVLVLNSGRMEVRTTGANTWGQLGQGDRKERCRFTRTVVHMPGVVAVQCGDEHSAAITCRGVLYLWGRGDSGQLGLGDDKGKWKPTALKSFKVVHPEKTLRRSKRSLPVMRPVEPEVKRQRTADNWHYM
ncbi:putative E3 ubiquitin-protein ligase [Tetrabaena socialis]|uniref:Putative E3 ubiquitin-protein ligase n=1 Tax=Tetrabaena socialis TaxID=47790 RepID=A0A2J8AJN9_9CHLO|nr:putative E3 ubiquitin-protein ligase [Tetrabaena socialis]|eukprot:PNH12742.1 putative E3 ubiquitin-protein ligase [Tetrabaena socialis]